MGGALDRAGILAARDIRVERVDVPEWGNGSFIFLRSLSQEDLAKLRGANAFQDPARSPGFALCLSLCDEQGAPVLEFPDAAATLLANNTHATLRRLYDIVERLSGLRAKDAEDAEKNSSATPSDASISS